MEKFYKILDNEDKVKTLSQKSDLIELKELEYLVAIDICSFRLPQCRSVLGDRSWSITQKRLRAKMRLSEVLDFDDTVPEHIQGDSSKIGEVATQEDDDFDFSKVKTDAIKKDKKTKEQIHQEVFIEEINQELIKNINKCEGCVVNVLMKNERISSFEKLWMHTFEEHYKDIERKEKLKEITEKHTKKKTEVL